MRKDVNRIPALLRSFHGRQALLLAATGALLLWIFHATNLDLRLEAPYYDAVNDTFPWRYAWVSKYLVHRYVKYALLCAGVMVWLVALAMARGRVPRLLVGYQRRWWLVAWAFVCVPLLLVGLRNSSAMHCPWDIDAFGGYAPYADLLSTVPADIPRGSCFPAAGMSVGAWLLAFALLWFPEHRLRSYLLGLVAFAVAFGLGWSQQMRGAHFLSHTLWSLWISWATILVLHRLGGAWKEDASRA